MTSIIGIENRDDTISYVYLKDHVSGFKIGLDLVDKYNNSRSARILIKSNLEYRYTYEYSRRGDYKLYYTNSKIFIDDIINDTEYQNMDIETRSIPTNQFINLKTDDIKYIYLYQDHRWKVLF